MLITALLRIAFKIPQRTSARRKSRPSGIRWRGSRSDRNFRMAHKTPWYPGWFDSTVNCSNNFSLNTPAGRMKPSGSRKDETRSLTTYSLKYIRSLRFSLLSDLSFLNARRAMFF